MIFEGFKLHAVPTIHEAYCTNKKCKRKPELIEVSNGLLSTALFCWECKSVYLLKLERVEKVSKEYMNQCLEQLAIRTAKVEAVNNYHLNKVNKSNKKKK